MASPGEITLVVLGPMTNIALALALEPDLPRNVKRVVAMGGVLQVMGNVSPVASANILGDAHAADIVLGTPWDVILVLADTTRQVRVTDKWLQGIRANGGKQGEFIHDISRFYRDFYRSGGVNDGFYNHDPTAMAFVVDQSLFQTEQRAIRVVTDTLALAMSSLLRKYIIRWRVLGTVFRWPPLQSRLMPKVLCKCWKPL